MIHKLMESIIAFIVAITGLLAVLPRLIGAIAKYQKERAEFAEKLGIPQQSMSKMMSIFAERLLTENGELKERLTLLEQHKTECDQQIAAMNAKQAETDGKMGGLTEANKALAEANQKLTEEVAVLRAQLLKKDEVIQEQDGRIKQQEKRIHELEGEYKKVQGQVDELTAKLREAEVKLKESGGGE